MVGRGNGSGGGGGAGLTDRHLRWQCISWGSEETRVENVWSGGSCNGWCRG